MAGFVDQADHPYRNALALGRRRRGEQIPTGSNAAPPCDPGHGTKFAAALCCNSSLRSGCRQAERMPAATTKNRGR
jgi:hypothetical protein